MLIREYDKSDSEAIARIHDAARLDELRDSAGVTTFLTLAQTAEGGSKGIGRALPRPAVSPAGERAQATVLDGNPASTALVA